MSFDDDHQLALKLQKEFDALDGFETNAVSKFIFLFCSIYAPCFDMPLFVYTCTQPPIRKRKVDELDLNATQNIVHPEWENVDPTPDIFSLFGAFDIKFFQGKLKCVELEWSKKMYQCAGICYQRRNGLGMSITIRLSEPLLKLRSRQNLIETLLVCVTNL